MTVYDEFQRLLSGRPVAALERLEMGSKAPLSACVW